jgi:hypothetical protein
MKTQLKFICVSKTIRGAGESQTKEYEFTAVTTGEANKSFWKWTPSGSLKFQCVNPAVDFETGKEYDLELEITQG